MFTRILTNEGAPLYYPDGSPASRIKLTFTLVRNTGIATDVFDSITGERIAPGPVTVTTDDDGVFNTPLWPTTRGDAPTYYLCKVPILGVMDIVAPLPDNAGPYTWIEFKAGGTGGGAPPWTPSPLEMLDVSAWPDLATAIADISTYGKTLWISTPVACDTLSTAGREIRILCGGMITVNAGHTLTIGGGFEAGSYQVFAGSGAILGLNEARPVWFGVPRDGVTNGSTAFTRMLATGALSIPLDPGLYLLDPFTLPDWVHMYGVVYQIGVGTSSAAVQLIPTNTAGDFITAGANPLLENFAIRTTTGSVDTTTATFSGNTVTGLKTAGNVTLRNMQFIHLYHAIGLGGSPYYVRTQNVEFNRCDVGYYAATVTPYNLHIDAPVSRLTRAFFAGSGVYGRNIKVLGGSIEGFRTVASSFKEISFFGTYFESTWTGSDTFAIDPLTSNSSVSLFGCLVYINGIKRFVNGSGYTNFSLTSHGNVWEGYDATAAGNIIFYLPSSGNINLAGDRVSSNFQDTALYVNSVSVALNHNIQMPILPATNSQAAYSGLTFTRSIGNVTATLTAEPTQKVVGMKVLAHGTAWDPLGWGYGRPYEVMWQGDRWYPVSGNVPTISSANPDTSGATLAALETEVNQIKAALRISKIIAT